MKKDLLISLILHSEKEQKLIYNASCAGMNEMKAVLCWFDNRYKYWGNAAPNVTIAMSSDGACGWGMNDLQYFVWKAYAVFEATEWSCKFYMKSEVGGGGGSQSTSLNSTAFADF